MFDDKLSNYFDGVAAKYLSAVDAEPKKSNQHEIGGLPSVGFKKYLGTPAKNEEYRFRARQIYISDETEAPVICDSQVTWYDVRRNVDHRGPEYRLYYYKSPVTSLISEGDFFLLAKLKEGAIPATSNEPQPELYGNELGSLLMVFSPAGSTIESQLKVLFGLESVTQSLTTGKIDKIELLLPLRLMLEDMGIEISTSDDAANSLDILIHQFGGARFPSTAEFSGFARENTKIDVSPIDEPDKALLAWMDHEESLFRVYERHIVQERLRAGFGDDGQDVDAFIDFSLSVQNRRKSRVGHAFEGHLSHLFKQHKLQFEQGRGKGKVTENNSKPDFIFPSFPAYHDPYYPANKLLMLGAKTTCKDRWRQVLSEADRIANKHLITLEAAISEQQTIEMQSQKLQLVVPEDIHSTYTKNQKVKLWTLKGFIEAVRASMPKSTIGG